jgi:hypothetical protein
MTRLHCAVVALAWQKPNHLSFRPWASKPIAGGIEKPIAGGIEHRAFSRHPVEPNRH